LAWCGGRPSSHSLKRTRANPGVPGHVRPGLQRLEDAPVSR
jgi:hypothetical protein